MDKKIRIIGIIAALAFSTYVLTSEPNPPPLPKLISESENKAIQILATELKNPRSFDFADEKIFVTEKKGSIRVIESGILLEESLATFRPAQVFNGGLLGITTHPDFSNNHFLYVYMTYENNSTLWNKVIKISESNNKVIDVETIFDNIPGSKFSNGGVLKFGPDGKLYITTGSVSESSHNPQNIESLEGKILRINDDGTIPYDNPFSNSPVYSFGHNNPQGLAWNSKGDLYATELGPSKNDEINLIQAGQNFGWPAEQCSGNEEGVDSIMCYDPSIEPGGIIFYSDNKLPYENNLIMATLRGENLFQLIIDENGLESQQSILGGVGRIRDVGMGPDGFLYVITSNTDGKGFPSSTDDRLLRIVK